MEQDESPNPVDVDLLGADAVVTEADALPDLVEQAGFAVHDVLPSVDIRCLSARLMRPIRHLQRLWRDYASILTYFNTSLLKPTFS
ncbi:MAG: hypothetical protein U5K33_04065 [Halofilum sp. (in: g-proteobacteria)]|nr:hypothetical protein [Halofilum sp. (in: g-proteobacteria)]